MKPYYSEPGITIYHGDCREILPQLGKVDLVLTDPPYGIKRFRKGFGYTRFRNYGAERVGLSWDNKPTDETMALVWDMAPMHIVWGANNFVLPCSQAFLVWDKYQTVNNFASAELAYCDCVSLTAKVFRYSIHEYNQEAHFHPTQKPVKLMAWCIQCARDIHSLIDPFMGSGSTLLAAKNLNRHAIGIEIEERYCEIAAKRLAQAVFDFSEPAPIPEQLELVS